MTGDIMDPLHKRPRRANNFKGGTAVCLGINLLITFEVRGQNFRASRFTWLIGVKLELVAKSGMTNVSREAVFFERIVAWIFEIAH
jgi:hypothetical protein